MHEWALAEAVASAAIRIAKEEKLKSISIVNVSLGELQQVDVEIFKFALSEIKSNIPMLKDADFNVKIVKAEFKCRVCGYRWTFRREILNEEVQEAIHFIPELAHSFIRCPNCSSPDFEVVKGRGVWLESIVGVK